jgi:hypothetical protein
MLDNIALKRDNILEGQATIKKEIKIKYQLNINIILCVTLEGEKYKLL